MQIEYPRLKSAADALQLSVKQTAFYEQQLKRGIITVTPGLDLILKDTTTKSFIVEAPAKNSKGEVVGQTRVLTEETFVREAEGSLYISPAGEVSLRSVTDVGACFVAGTLVHTDKGLVPIEKLRVGDMVLSQPEMKGELTYTPVVNTFVHEDKIVYLIEYYGDDDMTANGLVATGNHPFWVVGKGWTSVENLLPGERLELRNGNEVCITNVLPVFETETPDVGWCRPDDWDRGASVDLRDETVKTTKSFDDYVVNVHGRDAVEDMRYLKRRVYNIEVADTHTYYVGESGVWVHNANCGEAVGTVAQRGVKLNSEAEVNAGLGVHPEAAVLDPKGASEPSSASARVLDNASPLKQAFMLFERDVLTKPETAGYAKNIMFRDPAAPEVVYSFNKNNLQPGSVEFRTTTLPDGSTVTLWKGAGKYSTEPLAGEMTGIGTYAKEAAIASIEAECFSGDTYVVIEGGKYEEIQYIGVGQKVLSRCEITGEIAYRKVTRRFERLNVPTYDVGFSWNGQSRPNDWIETTFEHPFWVAGKGWIAAADLRLGDVLQAFDGATLVVDLARPTKRNNDVHNLEIEGFHTYFVSLAGVWVHNTCRTPITVQDLPIVDHSATVIQNAWTPDRVRLNAELDTLRLNESANYQSILKIQSTLAELDIAEAVAKSGEPVIFSPAGSDKLPGSDALGKEWSPGKFGDPDLAYKDGQTIDVYRPSGANEGTLGSIQRTVDQKSQRQASTVAIRLSNDGAPGITINQVVAEIDRAGVPSGLRTLMVMDQNGLTRVVHYPATELNKPLYGTIDANGRMTRSDAPLPKGGFVLPQAVFGQGPSLNVVPLTLADIDALLPAAHQYWLAQGARASVLNGVQISIGQIPTAIAGQTQGTSITLSADGAGWGWFVDATPEQSEEFSADLALDAVLSYQHGHMIETAHLCRPVPCAIREGTTITVAGNATMGAGDKLLDTLYEDFRDVSDRVIDSHVKNLRRKLDKHRPQGSGIVSVYGVGYRFDPDAEPEAP